MKKTHLFSLIVSSTLLISVNGCINADVIKMQAQRGDVSAQDQLGWYYLQGSPSDNIPQNYSKASSWFKKAAENSATLSPDGDCKYVTPILDARYNLGILYQEGKGVEQSNAKAKNWFKKVANKNIPTDYLHDHYWLKKYMNTETYNFASSDAYSSSLQCQRAFIIIKNAKERLNNLSSMEDNSSSTKTN